MTSAVVDTIVIYQGIQCKYYKINNIKYHIRFPMEWAHNHTSIHDATIDEQIGTGPEECGNCNCYGSIRGIFVGYCSNCLRSYIEIGEPRGLLIAPGLPNYMLDNREIWSQYPYLYGVDKSEIGDEENVVVPDEDVNLERYNSDLEEERRVSEDDETECDNNCDVISIGSCDETVN